MRLLGVSPHAPLVLRSLHVWFELARAHLEIALDLARRGKVVVDVFERWHNFECVSPPSRHLLSPGVVSNIEVVIDVRWGGFWGVRVLEYGV